VIDTAKKRRAAAGVPFLPLGPNVTPNAAKDIKWRSQAGWSYRAFLAGGDISVLQRYRGPILKVGKMMNP